MSRKIWGGQPRTLPYYTEIDAQVSTHSEFRFTRNYIVSQLSRLIDYPMWIWLIKLALSTIKFLQKKWYKEKNIIEFAKMWLN